MIRIAARTTNGQKLKMEAKVGSLAEAWEVLQTEMKTKKVAPLVAVQLTTSRQPTGGLRVVEEKPAKKGRK